jgi:hypothetical protein
MQLSQGSSPLHRVFIFEHLRQALLARVEGILTSCC